MKIASVRGLKEVPNLHAFLGALVSVSAYLGIDPSWLAAVISFESAGTFAPDIRSGGGRWKSSADNNRAVGLIQFTGSALKSMSLKGWSTSKDDLARMTAVEQMLWVQRYFEAVGARGRMHSVDDVAMAVFAPVGIGKEPSYVLYREPSAAYTANKNLDVDKTGTITKREYCVGPRTLLQQASTREPLEAPDVTDIPFPGDECASTQRVDVDVRELLAELQDAIVSRLDNVSVQLARMSDEYERRFERIERRIECLENECRTT